MHGAGWHRPYTPPVQDNGWRERRAARPRGRGGAAVGGRGGGQGFREVSEEPVGEHHGQPAYEGSEARFRGEGGWRGRGGSGWRGRGARGGDGPQTGSPYEGLGPWRGGGDGKNSGRPPIPQRPQRDDTDRYGADGRRFKKDVRKDVALPLMQTYLAASEVTSSTTSIAYLEKGPSSIAPVPPPPLLVLDLNNTLICRAARTRDGSKQPLVRPYLSTFLSYICSTSPSGRGRFQPVVHSSSRAGNVLSMLVALNPIMPHRLSPSQKPPQYNFVPLARPPYEPSEEEGDVISLVITRELMGLSTRDYYGDVETTKDLARVWEEEGYSGLKAWYEGVRIASGPGQPDLPSPDAEVKARFDKERDEVGARRTILLDDEVGKAAQQPHSHLPIHPFLVLPEDFPESVHNPARPMTAATYSAPPMPPRSATSVLELDPSKPAAHDAHLLITIYYLELLRQESNISSALRGGFIARIREQVAEQLAASGIEGSEREVEAELAQRGEMVCEGYGIKVKKGWDPHWREKLLRREKRPTGGAGGRRR